MTLLEGLISRIPSVSRVGCAIIVLCNNNIHFLWKQREQVTYNKITAKTLSNHAARINDYFQMTCINQFLMDHHDRFPREHLDIQSIPKRTTPLTLCIVNDHQNSRIEFSVPSHQSFQSFCITLPTNCQFWPNKIQGRFKFSLTQL